MNILYHEKQRSSLITIGAFLIGILILLYVIVFEPVQNSSGETQPQMIIMIIIAGIMLFSFASFFNLTIIVTDQFLQFGFGLFKKKLQKGVIKEISIKDFEFKNYMGYGIRMGKDKSWGYIASARQGILLITEKKKYFITTDNPDQLKDMIKNYLM